MVEKLVTPGTGGAPRSILHQPRAEEFALIDEFLGQRIIDAQEQLRLAGDFGARNGSVDRALT